MQYQDIITSQYHAALEMLRRAIVACPDELWNHVSQSNRFWHVAYHTLFYAHLYVQPSEADFTPWENHRRNLNFMGTLPWPPHEAVEPGKPYSKDELLAYLSLVRDETRAQTANLDIDRSDSGFEWLPMGKLELQIYSIRHIQQHAGELCQRLHDHCGIEIDWVGMGRKSAGQPASQEMTQRIEYTENPASIPGTAKHQALLRAIVAAYEGDRRVRAVVVFGSLSRGDWDAWSDIDLDVVIADGVAIDPVVELRALCATFEPLGERTAVIVANGTDAGDVVLESLMHISVRYHNLTDTSPNIVANMQVLTGTLSHAAITAAGQANRSPGDFSGEQLLDACVRYAAVANVYLQRRRVWLTVEILYRMRNLVLQLFALSHGYDRSFHSFEAEASPALQARLGATLPNSSLASLRGSLELLIDILETDLSALSAGHFFLTPAHRIVLTGVRQDLVALVSPT